ncbi:hypothetical protein [Tropicibacter sp. S64]|uniref:hypothetical protein n=1 Tax=Tropicibacter sp. S64 TaxID=3415122 RepID=UPI003C797F50
MILRRLLLMALALSFVWMAAALAEDRFGTAAHRRDWSGLLEDFFLAAVYTLIAVLAGVLALRKRLPPDDEIDQTDHEQML